ncbi:MAG: methyltransferase domain-containing protein [Pseudomonadota bacterium]
MMSSNWREYKETLNDLRGRGKDILSRSPLVSKVYLILKRKWNLFELRKEIRVISPLNVVIGAGATHFEGWISTDQDVFDITKLADWRFFFKQGSIDRLLAEHVMEHLSDTECYTALTEAYRCLRDGGVFRIAVPDGYRRDSDYVKEVAPPHDGHKQLFTIDSLVPMLQKVGFVTKPLEYFDAEENFHFVDWNERDGYVERSRRFDKQENFRRGDLCYTSLIVDALKR